MSCSCEGGFDSLDSASDTEEDLLDKAWGLEATSKLSCQVVPKAKVTVIELPKIQLTLSF